MVRAALRILGFEVKGLVALGLWLARRKHGVPAGAITATYAKEQTFMLSLLLFATVVETVVLDLLLAATGVPGWLRSGVLIADLYGLLFGVMLAATCATRPHVLTAGELRVRYGAYFDLRVPRDLIASVRTSRDDNAKGMVTIEDGRLSVAVASRTNVTIELTEPIAVVRPLGRRAEAGTIRFFADDPGPVVAALRSGLTLPS
ncbi:hypothetical protein [Nonomuraea sp. NPDC002799]